MKRLCVYCGSSSGRNPLYQEAAKSLAKACLQQDLGLIYGGARVGLMGTLADTLLAGGGQIIGIIPKSLQEKEIAHTELTRLEIVDSMHERKARMEELADGFIALPGGMGTLDEMFEILTWAQLGLHQKPCGLLNINHYFDGLINFLDHSVEEGFVRAEHKEYLLVESQPERLLERMQSFSPPNVTKWIGRKEI